MRILIAAGIVMAALLPAAAGAYELTIQNLTESDVVGMTAEPGEIEGFKRVKAGVNKTFEITMPDGECVSRLVFRFDDGTESEVDSDLCNEQAVRITQQY